MMDRHGITLDVEEPFEDWEEATVDVRRIEHVSSSSVELGVTASGKTTIAVKVYADPQEDITDVSRRAQEAFDALVAKYAPKTGD